MSTDNMKQAVIDVPQNKSEANSFVSEMGKEKREIEKIEAKLNKDIEALKEKAKARLEPHENKLYQMLQGLYIYAEGHRNELTENGKVKTVVVPAGKFLWRMGNKTVHITNQEEALRSIKAKGLAKDLIKTVESIIKTEVKKQPEKVIKRLKGLSVGRSETFRVEPNKTSVIDEEVTNLRKKS